MPHLSGAEERIRDVHRIDEAGAGAVDVDARALQAHFRGNDAPEARSHVFIDHVGAQEQVDVARLQAGIGKGFAGGIRTEVLQPFVGDDMAGTDSRPGIDPLVGSIEEGGKVVVGDHLPGKGAAGSENSHIVQVLVFRNKSRFLPANPEIKVANLALLGPAWGEIPDTGVKFRRFCVFLYTGMRIFVHQ